MNISLDNYQLGQLLQQAAELGAKMALVKTGRLKPYLTKAESFRLYGRKNVIRWIDEELVTVRKDGDYTASWRLDRIELEVLSKSREIIFLL